MKVKVVGVIVGVLAALAVIGVGTLWAQGGGPSPTPNTPTTTMCDQYLQSLATHLNTTVDNLKAAGKAAAKDMVAQALKDGKLTQDQANTLNQRIDQANGNCFGGFGFGRGFFGFPWFRNFPGPKNQNPNNGQQPNNPNPNGPRRGFPRPGQGVTPTVAISGATLTDVVADSPAAKAGLQKGDIIVSVGGQAIDQQHLFDALIRAHKPGDAVEFKYQRGSTTNTVTITLGAQPNNASTPYLGVQFVYRRGAT
jgi:membrane-associated protease RseP (regulator of RpoE activity)